MANTSSLKSINTESKSQPHSFGELMKLTIQEKDQPTPIQKQWVEIKLQDIRVQSWFPKKFISQGEFERALDIITTGRIGVEPIVVRYITTGQEKYYELIDGLVTLKVLLHLGKEKTECQLIEDKRMSKSEAIITSLALNSKPNLNHWESTIAGLAYLVEELNIQYQEQWTTLPITGSKKKIIFNQIDQAKSLCENLLKLRAMEVNKNAKKKIDTDLYTELKNKVNQRTELVIERMLRAIDIDLPTFIHKRIPLIKLPKNITNALSQGKLHYSKAIKLSRLGCTPQIKALVDVLGDVDTINAINKEQADLLQITLDKNLTCKELSDLVEQANSRIFMVGTNEDDKSLSIDEIGDRKTWKSDLEFQMRTTRQLGQIKSKIRNFNFLQNLTEEQKSRMQVKLDSLFNYLQKIEA